MAKFGEGRVRPGGLETCTARNRREEVWVKTPECPPFRAGRTGPDTENREKLR